ncbi:YjjG family noncanonical pyrimidine nucleotidase [Celerinatantimonas sp. YJH-8]|uniref:YjjG family noncanonical pyrimidine nucleotidase n=1 Tax=Celerinatantimonas sp. YJH-8 TaxID=3228714 RepID=UPI0038C711A1
MKYQHIFFDLDHTLWDFDRNARLVLVSMYQNFLKGQGFSQQQFIDVYEQVNRSLWDQFNHGQLDKQQLRAIRFSETFRQLGVNEGHFELTPIAMDEWYLHHCAEMDGVFPGCYECLDILQQYFHLHLITNGFTETQYKKMASAKLTHYFEQVFVSDEVGAHKPDPAIFEYAMQAVHTVPEACLMVGDSLLADIEGAKRAGIDQVWFNPNHQPSLQSMTYQIQQLLELPTLLGVR